MDLNTILLVIAGLVPAVVLCCYIYKKDRVEKEPIKLLVTLLLLGAFSCIPAAFIEGALIDFIQALFSSSVAFDEAGNIAGASSVSAAYMYIAVENFIGIAFVEEILKWIILVLVTKNNKEFNSLFDGMIYAIFVSLGFAALENVLYVVQYGWTTAIMRAILSVPGHMFDAVLMGYYYSFWKVTDQAASLERQLQFEGKIPGGYAPFSSKNFKMMSILMPVLAHGFYDFCCSVNSYLFTIGLYAFVIFLYIYCFGKIRKLSSADNTTFNCAQAMIMRKYPTFQGMDQHSL